MLEDRTLLAVTAYVQAHTLFVSGDTTTDSVVLDVHRPQGGSVGVDVADNGTPVNGSHFNISTFSSLNVLTPGSLTIQSGTFLDPGGITIQSGAIIIDPNVTLSTRQFASGVNPLTANSTGNSAAVALTAPNIQVGNGASILANATTGFPPADVTLTADDEANLNFALGLTGFKDTQTSTSIAIGSATIEAKDVHVLALSSTSKTLDLTQNLTDSRSVVMSDLNGDGHKDLIVGNDNGPVQIYLNDGTADPFNGVLPIDLTNSSPTVGLAVADVTGNGRQDLIVANQGAPTLLYLNSGHPSNPFGGVAPIAIANVNATSVAVADVTGDGRADLIIGVMSTNPNQLTPSQLFVNTGIATNPFGVTPINIAGADCVTSLTVVNLNGDAHPDLVVGQSGLVSNGTTSGEPTRVFLNTGSATNPFGGGSLNVGATDLMTTAVAVADLNGDGHPDLIVAHDGEPTQLFLNSNSISNPFGGVTPQNITTSESTTSLAVADVNGDGHPDLIVGNFGDPTQLYLNDGSQTTPFTGVTPKSITAQGDDTASVAVGDLNGDGNPDLIVGLNGDFPRAYLNNHTSNPFTKLTDTLNPESQLAYQANESAVLKFNLMVAAIMAQSTSSVTIATGANIVASADVTLNAQAITNAQDIVSGTFVGGAYADSEPTAQASIAGGAIITAGGSFDLAAITQNTVNLLTIIPTDASPGTATFSYEKARSTSTANVAAGDTITAGSAAIVAQNINLFSNVAKSLGLQSSGAASFGVAVAIGDVQSVATASVLGTVHTTNNTSVTANSTNTNNLDGAIAAVLNGLQQKGLVGPVLLGLGNLLSKLPLTETVVGAIVSGGGTPELGVSAGVAVLDSVNTANAFVGPTGTIDAHGNVTIAAKAQDNIKSYAGGGVSEAEEAAIGGGVDDSQTNNQANAYVAAGGTINAGLLFHVVADADIPNPVQLFGTTFAAPPDITGTNSSNGTDRVNSGYNTGPAASLSVVDWLEQLEMYVTTVLTGRLGSVGTTYAQSEGEVGGSNGVGISGDANFFTVTNAGHAYVGAGALVNQNASYASKFQDVEVESDTNIETINLAGQLSALSLSGASLGGAAGGDAGFGGSLEDITYNNSSLADIDNQAKVSAGGNIRAVLR